MLSECHGHIFMDGIDYKAACARHSGGVDKAAVRRNLSALKEAGADYFRDGGDPFGVSVYAREIAPEYGIKCATPAFAIHRQGHYGGIVGRAYEDMREYRELLRLAAQSGADFIKLMVSGIVTFRRVGELSCPSLAAEEISELIRAAHGEGFPVMIHVNGAETILACIEAGADSIEHGYGMDGGCIEALAQSKTVWVPTLAAVKAFEGRAGFDQAVVAETLEEHRNAVRRAAELGAHIASGSDSGAVGVAHGSGMLREYELLAGAGASALSNGLIRARFSK